MFKHILVPTGGSALSDRAVQGIAFARATGARVTALHVPPRLRLMAYRSGMLEQKREEQP